MGATKNTVDALNASTMPAEEGKVKITKIYCHYIFQNIYAEESSKWVNKHRDVEKQLTIAISKECQCRLHEERVLIEDKKWQIPSVRESRQRSGVTNSKSRQCPQTSTDTSWLEELLAYHLKASLDAVAR